MITMGRYKDIDAIVLENDTLSLRILPALGSKLASILFKPMDYELLWQNPGAMYKKTKYGDDYPLGEASGFDEMFPTINRCRCENEPWSGTVIPDHGEVWSLPWDYVIEKDQVVLSVHGIRLPYRLEKKLSLQGSDIIIRYKATNLSPFDIEYIWAAHPLFNASKGMKFIVPAGMSRVINSVPGSRLRTYGKQYAFPCAMTDQGDEFDLSVVPQQNATGCQKYYFAEKMTEGWCGLHDPERELNIGMAFPREKVPYLGVWVNEGGFDNQYNIAPEPATGGMDCLDAAKLWGMNSVLPAQSSREWWLNISVNSGDWHGHDSGRRPVWLLDYDTEK